MSGQHLESPRVGTNKAWGTRFVVFLICNLIQAGGEAGQRASSKGVLCVILRFLTFDKGKSRMGFNRRSGMFRLTYSVGCCISRGSQTSFGMCIKMQIPDLLELLSPTPTISWNSNAVGLGWSPETRIFLQVVLCFFDSGSSNPQWCAEYIWQW